MAIVRNGVRIDLKERAEAIEKLIQSTSNRLGISRSKNNRYKYKSEERVDKGSDK